MIATNSVTRAPDEDVAYAVASVTVFGSLSMFLYLVCLRLAGTGLAEALPSLSRGIAAIGNADPARHWLAAIQRLAIVAVCEFEVGEPATRQVINTPCTRQPVPLLAGLLRRVLSQTHRTDSSRIKAYLSAHGAAPLDPFPLASFRQCAERGMPASQAFPGQW